MTKMIDRQRSAEAPSEEVWRGVASLLDTYMSVSPEDYVPILFTGDARSPAAWVAAELKVRGIGSDLIGMNATRDDTIAARLQAHVNADTSACLKLLTVERNTMSHTTLLRSLLDSHGGSWRAYRMINASADLFAHAFTVSPQRLSAVNGAMLERLMPASGIRVTSSSGTDLEIRLDSSRYRWVSNRGLWRSGGMTMLPPGEVSTFPAAINGTLVADGAFNVTAYTALDARLGHCPVTVEIEEGRMVAFSCDNPDVETLIRRCLTHPNADVVGELGFGTNYAIPEFVAMNSHINERRAGLHIGFGEHSQRRDVAGYSSDIHLDLITSDSTIWFDGNDEPICSDELHRMTGAVHPTIDVVSLYDEDIDGDCCGLLSQGPDGGGCVL